MKFKLHTWSTLAEEASDPIVTGSTVETSSSGAIVDILRTIRSGPAVDADARKAAVRIRARGSILANARPQSTLVHILITIRPRKRRRTLASVAVDSVDARRSILTQMSGTIVDILLAIGARKTYHKQNSPTK